MESKFEAEMTEFMISVFTVRSLNYLWDIPVKIESRQLDIQVRGAEKLSDLEINFESI